MRFLIFALFAIAFSIIVPYELRRWRQQDEERARRRRDLRTSGVLDVRNRTLPPATPMPPRSEGGRRVHLRRTRRHRQAYEVTPWWTELLFVAILLGIFLSALLVLGGRFRGP